jgi:hypothetical protein
MRVATCTVMALLLLGAASASARDLPGRSARSPHQAPRVDRRAAFLPAERDKARAATTEARVDGAPVEVEPPFEDIPGAAELGREEHDQLRNGRREEEERAERELNRPEEISLTR